MVQVISNNDMSAINNSDVAVVDFSATWCGPCKMLAPVLEQVSEEMSGKAQFFNVDVDANEDLAKNFGIMAVPTVFIMKKGERAGYFTGFKNKDDLIATIEEKL